MDEKTEKPTKERVRKGGLAQVLGRYCNIEDFGLNKYYKKIHEIPGRHDGSTRYRAAQKISEMWQKATQQNGVLASDVILSSSGRLSFDDKIITKLDVCLLMSKLPHSNRSIVYYVCMESRQPKEAAKCDPSTLSYAGARNDTALAKLCEALDDLVDILQQSKIRF